MPLSTHVHTIHILHALSRFSVFLRGVCTSCGLKYIRERKTCYYEEKGGNTGGLSDIKWNFYFRVYTYSCGFASELIKSLKKK